MFYVLKALSIVDSLSIRRTVELSGARYPASSETWQCLRPL